VLQDSALISPEAAAKYGTVDTLQVEYQLSRTPSDDELAAAQRLLGHDDLLTVENGYQSPARLFLIGIIVAATVVTLLGVAISVSLSAAEGRADLATLAAIGAQPRRRRNLAAAQAWVLGQLGCVLGVGVGALYGYTAHAAFGSPRFEVPWLEIGAIVVVVPLFAGLLAWLMTRSRLPMVSRID
jgi:putative ABC transport system permease protein